MPDGKNGIKVDGKSSEIRCNQALRPSGIWFNHYLLRKPFKKLQEVLSRKTGHCLDLVDNRWIGLLTDRLGAWSEPKKDLKANPGVRLRFLTPG